MLAVLTVWIQGRPHRWATEEAEVTDADGDPIQISAGLTECEVDEPGDDAPPGASVSWDPSPFDFAELAAGGADLCDCAAEVAQIADGATWEEREILVYGRIGECEYGGAGDIATAQIGSAWADRGLLPPLDAVVRADTGEDMPMPWIIGKPPSTPGIVYNGSANILIAGHPVLATQVRVRDALNAPTTWHPLTVQREAVAGRLVSWVVGAWMSHPDTAQIEVDWSASEGGHRSVTGPGCPRSPRDVLAVVLSASTLPVDAAALASASAIDGFVLDIFLDQPAPASEIAADIIGCGLPAVIEAGPRGLRIKVDPLLATGPDTPIDLDGPDGSPEGLISSGGPRPPDSVTVRYRCNRDGDTTLSATVAAGQGPRDAVRLASPSDHDAAQPIRTQDSRPRALLRPGITRSTTQTPEPSPALTISAPHVSDPGCAFAIARYAMQAAAARRTLSWSAPLDRLAADDGHRVRLTCSRWHLADALAVVERVERDFVAGVAVVHARLLPS